MTVKLVTNEKVAETSSKGNQEKWFDKETDKWYKLDHRSGIYRVSPYGLQGLYIQRARIRRQVP